MSTIKSSAENLTLNADGSGNDVIIQSNGSTKAIITAESNVGIGTATPTSYNSNADNLVIYETGDNNGITLAADNDQGSNIYFADPEDNNVGGITYNHSSNYMNFRVNGAERLRVLSSGGLTFNGDTAAANALDDYEEGTWTPTTAQGWSSLTLDGTGSYTKIGNIVHVMVQVHVDGSGAGSGHLALGGLPFTSSSTADHRAAISLFAYNLASSVNGYITGTIESNENTVQMYEGGLSSSGSDLGAHFDAGSSFFFQATYKV